MATKIPLLDDALELADLLTPAWDAIRDGIPAWHPRNEDGDGSGDGGDGGSGDGDGDGEGSGSGDGGDGDGEGDGGAGSGSGETDWKAQARKHERRAKQERKAREEAERKLREREDANKSEHEKALEKAREEAKREALTEAEKERRADRLEVAVTRLAARGVKVGDKDGVKFADPEDALIYLERAIAKGDVDEDDIYDGDGKVQTDALATALGELLDRKPNLAAASGTGKPSGSSDAGKGGPGGDIEDLDVEGHLNRIKRHK